MNTMQRCATLIIFVLVGAASADIGPGFVRIRPNDIVWKDVPGYAGLKMAVIEGDPARQGIYVIRIKFPPGLMTRPHFHPEDRHATVLSGTWYTGIGDSFNPEKTVALPAGSYMKHPAGAAHFDGAKDQAVVLQIVGYGPSGTTMVRPEDGNTGRSRPSR